MKKLERRWVMSTFRDESGDTVLEFPPEFLEEMEWWIGDTITFDCKKDYVTVRNKSWEMRRKNRKKRK